MQGVPLGPHNGTKDPYWDPGTPIGTLIDKHHLQFTFDGGLVVAHRPGPRPGLFRRLDVVVEAAEEALADVGEALPGHAHVPLPDAEGLHEQLGGVLQVFHRNLGESKRDG